MEQTGTYYFEAITRYDRDTYREFARYHYRHVAPGLPTLLVVLGGLLLPLGFLALLGLIEIDWLLPLLAGVVFLAVGVNQFLGRFASGIKDIKENRVRFFEDRVEYAGAQEQGFYYYHQIVRLRESQGYFFLYVAKNRAMMIAKQGMTLGTPEQLRGFLFQKIRPQFR